MEELFLDEISEGAETLSSSPLTEGAVGADQHHGGDQKGEDIGYGHGVEDAVQAKKAGEEQGKTHAEDHLPDHGQKG